MFVTVRLVIALYGTFNVVLRVTRFTPITYRRQWLASRHANATSRQQVTPLKNIGYGRARLRHDARPRLIVRDGHGLPALAAVNTAQAATSVGGREGPRGECRRCRPATRLVRRRQLSVGSDVRLSLRQVYVRRMSEPEGCGQPVNWSSRRHW